MWNNQQFKIGKGVCQGCMVLSLCLFNLYAVHHVRFWAGWLTSWNQSSWIVKRNINNLIYAYDTTLMAEREELKNLLTRVKEESEKTSLKLNIQKTKIRASHHITSWQSVQSLSCDRLCNPVNCSTPGLLVHHPEFTQTHFH